MTGHNDELIRHSLLASYADGPRIWDAAILQPDVAELAEAGLIEPAPGGSPGSYKITAAGRDALAKPVYPEPGSEIPPENNGGQAGYVVGECGHRVAGQEWRAGFRNCERCPS